MDAQLLAFILLALRIVAVALLVAVVAKQIRQILKTHTLYPAVRIVIFILTIVLLIGQFIPIALDSVVAFGETYTGRSLQPDTLPVLYSLNNASKDVIIGALLVFLHYRPSVKR